MTRAVPPVLSFIIPVRNDATRLQRCLESIRATAAGVPSETIVADNGSTDDSAGVARRAGASVLELPERRVADVRNQAAKIATGEFLAFIDADHVLDRGWADAAVDALRDPAVSAAGAQYHPPTDGTWVQHTYDRLRNHQSGNHEVSWLPSGNLVIRRAGFEQAGGFDPVLETCEDVDLCQRLIERGGRVIGVERMWSVHHGDPATLSALFAGELWRGRDSIRVSLRTRMTARSMASVALPLLTLAALSATVVGIVTWPFGGWKLAAAGFACLAAISMARAWTLTMRAPARDRSPALLGRAWLVAVVYDIARALALVARSDHSIRRRT